MSQHKHNPQRQTPDGEADPVLDWLLSEALGGAAPPDLTDRIMQRRRELAKQAQADSMLPPSFASITAAARQEAGIESPDDKPAPEALPRQAAPGTARLRKSPLGNGRERRRRRRHRRVTTMYVTAIALSAAIVAASVGVIAYNQSRQAGGNGSLAGNGSGTHQPSVNQPSVNQPGAKEDQRPGASPDSSPRQPEGDQLVDQDRSQSDPNRTSRENQPQGTDLAANRFNGPPPFSVVEEANRTGSEPIEQPYVEPMYQEQVVALVDNHMQQAWADAGIDPSATAADSEWARRVYLRVLGRIPTVAELTHYMRDDSPDKQSQLLDLLLHGEKYADELAQNWAEFWTNTLIGRRGGMQADSLASRDHLTQYLRDSLAADKPFDQITYELLTAEGTNRPGSEDYNGAVNFLLASYDEQGKLATNRTTQVFLGKQLQCAQCHNHHVNEWPQQQYWQVNSFFRQMQAEKQSDEGVVRLVDRDFAGASGSYDEAEVFYQQVNGLGKVAYPVWLDGEAINPDGRVSEVRRRVELARRLVASDEFAQATANRLWDHFLGRGFTKPVDDMGPHNPPSHPDALASLAEQFAAHNYDLRQLIRWIALSEPFNLSSRPSATNLADTVETPERPLFSRYYTRQMEAEELYDSLVMLADSRTGSKGSAVPGELLAAKRDFVGQFAQDMNTDEGNEIINFDGSLQQSLSMMNGELMDRATDVQSGNILRRVLRSGDMSWHEKIEHLFLASLSRQPSRRELEVADRLLKTHRGDAAAALQDLWWALLNSNEFILDH